MNVKDSPVINPLDSEVMGRLAFREEGNFWNAYYALPNTMAGAVLLGSIAINGIKGNRKMIFMSLMREMIGDIIEEKFGVRPNWPNPTGQPAPEHERGGNA